MNKHTTTDIIFTNKSGDYIGTAICRDDDLVDVMELAHTLYSIKIDSEENYEAVKATIKDVLDVL